MNKNISSLDKLKMDFERSCHDHNLHGKMAYLKILLVVDFYPVAYFRLVEYCREKNSVFRKILKILLLFMKPFIEGFSGARIYSDAMIEGGLLLHQSSGVVIAPGSVIGKNCTLFSGACVVYKANYQGFAAPIIGDNVKLMVGSKVVGNVTVGNESFVAANAVVVADVPEYSIAVGVPAQVKPRKDIRPNAS